MLKPPLDRDIKSRGAARRMSRLSDKLSTYDKGGSRARSPSVEKNQKHDDGSTSSTTTSSMTHNSTSSPGAISVTDFSSQKSTNHHALTTVSELSDHESNGHDTDFVVAEAVSSEVGVRDDDVEDLAISEESTNRHATRRVSDLSHESNGQDTNYLVAEALLVVGVRNAVVEAPSDHYYQNPQQQILLAEAVPQVDRKVGCFRRIMWPLLLLVCIAVGIIVYLSYRDTERSNNRVVENPGE